MARVPRSSIRTNRGCFRNCKRRRPSRRLLRSSRTTPRRRRRRPRRTATADASCPTVCRAFVRRTHSAKPNAPVPTAARAGSRSARRSANNWSGSRRRCSSSNTFVRRWPARSVKGVSRPPTNRPNRSPRACRDRDCWPRSSPASTATICRGIAWNASSAATGWSCRARRPAIGWRSAPSCCDHTMTPWCHGYWSRRSSIPTTRCCRCKTKPATRLDKVASGSTPAIASILLPCSTSRRTGRGMDRSSSSPASKVICKPMRSPVTTASIWVRRARSSKSPATRGPPKGQTPFSTGC
jgi:hypothetical protein